MEQGLNFARSLAGEYLQKFTPVCLALTGLKEEIARLGKRLPASEYFERSKGVWVHETATIAHTVYIRPPCIIGARSEVRHCAFLRGGVLIGSDCVVGNSVELKNCVLFDGAKVPHLSYVGDSILGYCAHLGAGVICSNVKADQGEIGGSGLKKLGAVVCDYAEIGCNSVLFPGSFVGRSAVVYPLSRVRGTIPPDVILKGEGVIAEKRG